MAETLKVLAQSFPSATTLTNIYTVPALTSAAVSSITVCNTSVATSFRISIAVAGAADASKQYLFFDTPIAATSTVTIVIGITLAASDVIRVYATLATCIFNVFGAEVT